MYTSGGSSEIKKTVDMGMPFLVIGRSGDRLNVVEAEKVEITMSMGTWKYRSGFCKSS